MAKAIAILPLLFLLAACGGDDRLRPLTAGSGAPNEFTILPTKNLVIPTNLMALPLPTPGSPNLVDPTPVANAITALGGHPANAWAGGIPVIDMALVKEATKHGAPADIRSTLALEDARRRANRLSFRLPFSGGDRYFRTYSSERLDAYAELERLRGLGVATPTAPPRPTR